MLLGFLDCFVFLLRQLIDLMLRLHPPLLLFLKLLLLFFELFLDLCLTEQDLLELLILLFRHLVLLLLPFLLRSLLCCALLLLNFLLKELYLFSKTVDVDAEVAELAVDGQSLYGRLVLLVGVTEGKIRVDVFFVGLDALLQN